MQASRRHNN
jgi:hypothetical protein